MLLHVPGLVRRGSQYIYRRRVPHRLRSIIGAHEVKRTLGTDDLKVAKRKWEAVHAEVNRLFAEAEKAVSNPTVAAFKAVQEWRQYILKHGEDDDNEEGADSAFSTALERDAAGEKRLDPVQRSVLEALLKRHRGGPEVATEENPPLSIIFDRYHAEKKLPSKTKGEWDRVLSRFTESVGGVDVPVQAITTAHVRNFKTRLLTMHVKGRPISGTTVKKLLGALSTVLAWAKREGYLTVNPAEGITVARGRLDGVESGRLPYSADDLTAIFSHEREGDANHWLPWLALYTGARLEELGQLRTADVRREDGVDYLAIEPGDGKRVKTKSSRRRIPLHPELVKLGFLAFVQRQREAGHERLFPELRPNRHGALTAVWTKWWGHHAREVCGVNDPRKTYHSFRHLWKRTARTVMTEEFHDALTGHTNGSVGRTYGNGVPLKTLAEAMAEIKFEGLRD
jgi:integrase